MSSQATNIIQTFFGSLGYEAFLAEHWPGRPHHEHGDPKRLPEVLRASVLWDFKQLLRTYRGPAFYFARKGAVLKPLDRPALELYRAGHSLFLGDVGSLIRGSKTFLGALETELGITPGCTRMSVFASPRNDGAAEHYDTNEVFSIQLAGEKEFCIAPIKELDNPTGLQYSTRSRPRSYHYPQMAAGFPDPDGAEYQSVSMSPGSVLFMPRGTWHRTKASKDSVAVSIIVNPPPAVEAVLEQLKCTLLQDARWRRPLYGAWNEADPGAATSLEGLLADLQRVARTITPDQVLRGASDVAYRLDRMNADTRLQVIPTARVERSSIGGGSWRIQVVNHDLERGRRETLRITVDEKVADMIDWLVLQRGRVSVREIAARAEKSVDDTIELMKELGNGELVMPLWFDPLPER